MTMARLMSKLFISLMVLWGGQWAVGQCVDYGTDAPDGTSASSTSGDPCTSHIKVYDPSPTVLKPLESAAHTDFIEQAYFTRLSSTHSVAETAVDFTFVLANDEQAKLLTVKRLKLWLTEPKQLTWSRREQSFRMAPVEEIGQPESQERRVGTSGYPFNILTSNITHTATSASAKRRSA